MRVELKLSIPNSRQMMTLQLSPSSNWSQLESEIEKCRRLRCPIRPPAVPRFAQMKPSSCAHLLRPRSGETVTEKISKRKMLEERFAREYLLDLDGTQAAIRAGYSAKTAAQAASRMLRNVKVRALLKQLIGRFIAPPNSRAKHQKGIPYG